MTSGQFRTLAMFCCCFCFVAVAVVVGGGIYGCGGCWHGVGDVDFVFVGT